MDRSEALVICHERLGKWGDKLADELATPILLVGVKQDESRALVLCITEEVETNVLRTLLMAALRALPANGSHA